MGGFIFLIALIFVLANAVKSKKPKEIQNGQQKSEGASLSGPAPLRPTAVPTERTLTQQIEELLMNSAVVDEPVEPIADIPDIPTSGYAESESFEDDLGCVGGSLPHDPEALHEGESAAPLASVQAPAGQQLDFQTQKTPAARFSAEELRRAVIAREILGPPKALTRRQAVH